ncbi:LOW QUALITY PROTEIN: single-strand selective monofunctional uracil DNA glycosylase [Colius striatus]|uniref:LOW QUALITY PROTEIN: single-strand selective monofunctional uracil DNA glycosylase n=1 Tax=Colius striatus TaxID=57412 RepID=UPI002B1D1AB9|nr:LOW QUALITY PROTEIN: single-strand selective monofunctional uracil DNA glycosylase [Colius striatus]
MNPGPFGMAQTGVPFGDVWHVREWLRLEGTVNKPPSEHPARPVLGLSCQRAEVSGARFWGFIKSLCPEPHLFFRHCFVHNHCPLLFLAPVGRNLPPSDLPPKQRRRLLQVCDQALGRAVALLGVGLVVALGRFAERQARKALAEAGLRVRVEWLPHPSPRNPRANRGWEEAAKERLSQLGVLELLEEKEGGESRARGVSGPALPPGAAHRSRPGDAPRSCRPFSAPCGSLGPGTAGLGAGKGEAQSPVSRRGCAGAARVGAAWTGRARRRLRLRRNGRRDTGRLRPDPATGPPTGPPTGPCGPLSDGIPRHGTPSEPPRARREPRPERRKPTSPDRRLREAQPEP